MIAQEQMTKKLSILHFNDVYEIEGGNIEPVGGAARFVSACKQFKQRAGENGLVMFSGDLFSPSTLSVLYKGEQMLMPINECGIDVACVGNHEFDFPLEQITSLFHRCNFPWLCSNIFNVKTQGILAENHAFFVEERAGLRIGVMGLAESDWLNTISEIDLNIVRYEDFVRCAIELERLLREEHDCDIVIALTHMRVPNDRFLGKSVPGLDLILGGHDHIVISEILNPIGSSTSSGSTLFVKSGTDFKDFGLLEIEKGDFKADQPDVENTFYLKGQFKVTVGFHQVTKDIPEDEEVVKHVQSYVEKSKAAMSKVIGFTTEPLDTRFSEIRTNETNFGNFYADVIRRETSADVSIFNAGTIRSDCFFPVGEITYAMLNKALPFPDLIVVQQLTGADIIAALENGVSKWPTYEGRFPLISGIQFSFDPKLPSGSRVVESAIHHQPIDLKRQYSCATKWFVSQGKDGYDMFKDKPFLLDYENSLPHLQILVSFFKCLEGNMSKFTCSDDDVPTMTVKQSYEIKSSNEEAASLAAQRPQLLRRSSSFLGSSQQMADRIPEMRKMKRRQSRIEKVGQSGLVAGVRETEVTDENGQTSMQQFIVTSLKNDGRIKIIQ